MDINAINGGWFYDEVTARGVSFDGFLPQACKTPLGNTKEFELIHTPEKMAYFQNNDWYRKNWSLADTLMTFSPLQSDKHVLIDAYEKELCNILSSPCDLEYCQHDYSGDARPTRGSCRGLRVLHEDLCRYGEMMTGSNDLDDGKYYDVKKEIYRLTDRVFAALAKCYHVKAGGSFAILEELHGKKIISLEARDNFARASAIAIKLRISTYLNAGKQGEHYSVKSNEKTGKLTSAYLMPKDEELFNFFFVATPLYEELKLFKQTGNIPQSLAHLSFYDDSDITMGHVYCRLLKYDEALRCYERALQQNPKNVGVEIRRIQVALFSTKKTAESEKIQENLENILTQSHCSVNLSTLESTSFINGLTTDECRQLIDVLLFAYQFCKYDESAKYFELARKILTQCLTANGTKRRESDRLMLKFTFMNHFPENLGEQHETDAAISELISLIDVEGVSTKSIVWLKRLGEFLYGYGKLYKAYCCFQRALSMEHLLYATKPNINMLTSLKFLGKISFHLSKYTEGKFYSESLIQQFELVGGTEAKLLAKEMYLLLAFSAFLPEKTMNYVKAGLKVSTGSRNDKEICLDCYLYRELAATWYAQQNPDQTLKACLNAQACLKNVIDMQKKVGLTWVVAQMFCEIREINQGIQLLKAELQKLTLDSQLQEKVLYLKLLGLLCVEQGLAPDAEEYFHEALQALAVVENGEYLLEFLECRIGFSKAILMEGRVSEARCILNQAFISAKQMPKSANKCCFLMEIGKLCESIGEVSRARLCYFEAVKTRKEETNISKNEIKLEMKLGNLVENRSFIVWKSGMPHAQRSHYDRAADILREQVAAGQVDTRTVTLLASLALKYSFVDLDEKKRLLLEAFKVSEIIYGTSKLNKLVRTILEELSRTHFDAEDVKGAIEYREILMKKEMELQLLNPFHEHVSSNLMMWAFYTLEVPGSIEAIESAYELLFSAQSNEYLTSSSSKATAAKCLTFLSILFYTSNDVTKAKTLNNVARQLFTEIHECGETKMLPCEKTCHLMENILLSRMNLALCKRELVFSFREIFAADDCGDIKSANEEEDTGSRHFHSTAEKKSDSLERKSYPANDEHDIQERFCNELAFDQKLDKEQPRSTFVEVSKMSKNSCNSPRKNLKSHVLSSYGAAFKELESFPGELLTQEQLESINGYSSVDVDEIFLTLASLLLSQLNALEYNRSKGNIQQAAEIYASLQTQLLSFYESYPFDGGEMLINDAITAKEGSRPRNAIRLLDLVLQLPSDRKRKTKVLRLRGECFLSVGDFRTAAIDFTKAVAAYSSQTISSRDDLCEYSKVLVGLIKSEMLCKNVAAAWLICQNGIKLISDHDELKETMNLQALEFFYLGAKCVNILSGTREVEKGDHLGQSYSLCQRALIVCQRIEQTRNSNDSMEELSSSGHREFLTTKCEVQLLLAALLLKLQRKDEGEKILQEMKTFFMKIAVESELTGDYLPNERPELVKISYFVFSWIGRVLVMLGEKELSNMWLNRSLVAFFSVALPDLLLIYEEFLPLLQAITVAKSSTDNKYPSQFQQAIDMCKKTSVKQGHTINSVYEFLSSLVKLYRSLGQAEETVVVAKTALGIIELMHNSNVGDKMISRSKMQLYLAQIHQLNASNLAFDAVEEIRLAERYYLTNRDTAEGLALQKDLSYANFLCENKRFAEADEVLRAMSDLGELVWNKYVHFDYFSRVFYGPEIQNSVEVDGELLTTIGSVMYCMMVRVFVGMEKKKEAAATCENLTAVDRLDVHEAMFGKRSSCKPYLVGACHRQLLSFLSRDKDRKLFQNCDLPLSSTNLAKLYFMLDEYVLALKYFPNEIESPDLLKMKISCLHLAGNELVNLDRGRKSRVYFMPFLEMLQAKEGLLDLPFYNQCEVLERYSFADQYYIFRVLGEMHLRKENIDAAIHSYERCLDLDEDFTRGQDIVATLADLYQSKALTADLENQDSPNGQLDFALKLFEKLLQKADKLTVFAELTFASVLSRLGRYEEAIKHFHNVIKCKDQTVITYLNVDKPLMDAYLRREFEVRGGGKFQVPLNIHTLYNLILTYVKLNELEKAQDVALQLENNANFFWLDSIFPLVLSMAGYAYRLIGNKEKAAKIFGSVLKIIPGHPPIIEALESCDM